MSDLIAIVYPDEAAAGRARAQLAETVEKGVLDVVDVVVIAYDDDGRLFPLLGGWEVGFAAAGGAMAGGLIGLVLLGPCWVPPPERRWRAGRRGRRPFRTTPFPRAL